MDTIKKVMVLAGGNDQIELIKGIRNRFPEAEVLLIDMNPNVRAREFCDRMLVISTMDFDKVLAAAEAENIDLILSACGDQPLRTMAYVSEKMGLPCYLTFEQSRNLTDKGLMKRKMVEGGIPTSRYGKFDINSGIPAEDFVYPVVIKPADNNGSKGIIKVRSREELELAVAEARKYTLGGDMIIEEFKEGEEYSVEAFLKDGTPHIVFASKNIKIKNRNTFTICQNEYVAELPEGLEKRIKEIVTRIGSVFGIDNVPLLIQMIVNGEDVSVIEFSARTGGGSKLFFIREMVGVDVIENLLDITFSQTPDIEARPSGEAAVINYVYASPGKFMGLEGVDRMTRDGVISAVYQYKPFGSEIFSSNYSSDRPVGFLVKGFDREEVGRKLDEINRSVKVLDENGNDIMRHDLFNL